MEPSVEMALDGKRLMAGLAPIGPGWSHMGSTPVGRSIGLSGRKRARAEGQGREVQT